MNSFAKVLAPSLSSRSLFLPRLHDGAHRDHLHGHPPSGEHSLAHRHEPMGHAHAARARADSCALV
jgi:hypothetical protein